MERWLPIDDFPKYEVSDKGNVRNAQNAYNSGLRKPPRMKKVKIVETGEVFESMSDCARAIGGTVSGIYDCETGRQDTHRGYHFEWV